MLAPPTLDEQHSLDSLARCPKQRRAKRHRDISRLGKASLGEEVQGTEKRVYNCL